VDRNFRNNFKKEKVIYPTYSDKTFYGKRGSGIGKHFISHMVQIDLNSEVWKHGSKFLTYETFKGVSRSGVNFSFLSLWALGKI
jgi:hypothetical protein